MLPVRTLRLTAFFVFVLAVSVLGCSRDTTGYSGPMETEVRRAIPSIERATGLKFKEPPRLEMRTREEVHEFIEQQFNEQISPLELAGQEQAYKLFGLIPDTLDLRNFLLALLGEQVAGYYDPQAKTLYVVEGATPEILAVTVSHELVHALQDQYIPLDSARSLKGDNDRQMAMQAVVEGHATYEQVSSMLGSDLGLRMPSGWDRVRESIRSGQGSTPLFANAPRVIQETLLFSYLSGAEFIRQVKVARPGIPPFVPVASSTEQILHPEKFLADEVDHPVRITLSAPRNGSLVYENNFGEFEIRLFLYEHLNDLGLAVRGAEGWGGDRYQVIRTSRGAGVAWLTVWDSAIEAAEFFDVMQRLIQVRYNVSDFRTEAGDDVRSWTSRSRRLVLSAETVGGLPAVIFEDYPLGSAGRAWRASDIVLGEP